MPFVKQDKRINRVGRPRVRNKHNTELKIMLNEMICNYVSDIKSAQDELTIRDKIQFTRYILPFVLPKLQSVEVQELESIEMHPIEFNIKDLFRIDTITNENRD